MTKAHPIVDLLFAEMQSRKINPQILGRMASVNPETIKSWKNGTKAKSQTFQRMERCWKALGYEFVLKKR